MTFYAMSNVNVQFWVLKVLGRTKTLKYSKSCQRIGSRYTIHNYIYVPHKISICDNMIWLQFGVNKHE